MLKLHLVVCMACSILMVGMDLVVAQTYPSKPIRIVTTPAGGGGDFAVRIIGPGISGPLGQPVIIENRPGITVGEYVAQAPADGYTLLYGGSVFMFTPLLRKMPYDPVRDFAPVTLSARAPVVLVVHPSLRVKSVKELIALAKSRPGELNFAYAGPGGGLHIAGELLRSMTGANIVGVNYKGAAPGLAALMAGEVQIMFADVSAVAPHANSGRLRALAVTSPEPSILFPGLPTVAATVPGYDIMGIDGVWVRAGTPPPIVTRLNQEIVRVLNQPDVRQKFLSTGTEVVGSTPEQLAAAMKHEMTKTSKVIAEAGIKVE